MSRAATYAASCSTKSAEMDTVYSTRPASYKGGGLTASVTDAGGAALDRGVVLSPAEAHALGQWLVDNFAEIPVPIN